MPKQSRNVTVRQPKRKFIPLPSKEELLTLLTYDPLTGILRWTEAARRGGMRPHIPGDIATKQGPEDTMAYRFGDSCEPAGLSGAW